MPVTVHDTRSTEMNQQFSSASQDSPHLRLMTEKYMIIIQCEEDKNPRWVPSPKEYKGECAALRLKGSRKASQKRGYLS